MRSCIIKLSGLVQGVGFRPFVAKCATEMGVLGSVKNAGGIVIIEAYADNQVMEEFIHHLISSYPFEARIDKLDVKDIVLNSEAIIQIKEKGFFIEKSSQENEAQRIIPHDLPVCEDCRKELSDSHNRRYHYPFISCVNCGPRYSIIEKIPYDRDSITMNDFNMCNQCVSEYTDLKDRRCHAQTISCHDCGPKLFFSDNFSEEIISGTKTVSEECALDRAIAAINKGCIVAIKDIGGFHFAFRPDMTEPSKRLRLFKHRENKPFAVMFSDINEIEKNFRISDHEKRLLTSDARPIVLLKGQLPFSRLVCMDSDRVGAMLPCDPLQILILAKTGPLVMTSGNRGGEPIITDEMDMLALMENEGVPDAVLYNDRRIVTPLDDSIYQVSGKKMEHIQIIRRARGIVPDPIKINVDTKKCIFAAGGDLKSVFAISKNKLVYLSQHFGDLDDLKAQKAYMQAESHMCSLLNCKPEKFVSDMHPGYHSGRLAQDIVSASGRNEQDIINSSGMHAQNEISASGRNTQDIINFSGSMENVTKVQHHHAHVASVIAEHGITGKVLGIAFDGTGYGTDKTIWGSEFLLCKGSSYNRITHLKPVRLIGGDEGMRNADTILYGYMANELSDEKTNKNLVFHENTNNDLILPKNANKDMILSEKTNTNLFSYENANNNPTIYDNPKYKLVSSAIAAGINTYTTTSMGRLFDAAASALDVAHYNSYEGECAINLEILASKATKAATITGVCTNSMMLDGAAIIKELYIRKRNGEDPAGLALGFHNILSSWIIDVCKKCRHDKNESFSIALCGGTFLNRILLNSTIYGLEKENFKVYYNEQVPPGDGGLSLGQIYLSALS